VGALVQADHVRNQCQEDSTAAHTELSDNRVRSIIAGGSAPSATGTGVYWYWDCLVLIAYLMLSYQLRLINQYFLYPVRYIGRIRVESLTHFFPRFLTQLLYLFEFEKGGRFRRVSMVRYRYKRSGIWHLNLPVESDVAPADSFRSQCKLVLIGRRAATRASTRPPRSSPIGPTQTPRRSPTCGAVVAHPRDYMDGKQCSDALATACGRRSVPGATT
jgi:hypothetical protein